MLLELLNATLVKRPLNEKAFECATESDWQRCYDIALAQRVLAMTFPAMSSLPKELRPSLQIWAQWMAYTKSIADLTRYRQEIVKKMGAWLADEGLSTIIIKGFSLSGLYPNPDLREFSDIDIFSGNDYDAVNSCLAKKGVLVDKVDGHHAYLSMEGVSIEHHFAFSNTKVKKGLAGPEGTLQHLVLAAPLFKAIPGIYFPCPAFTVLFVGYHAYEHFLQEKIQIRHIIDWALALRQLSADETDSVNDVMANSRWSIFLNTLTAIAINQLKLPLERFPSKALNNISSIDAEQEKRVWYDILYSSHTPNIKNSNLRRFFIAKRMLNNRWKFKEYSNMSASRFLLNEFVGHLKTLNIKP